MVSSSTCFPTSQWNYDVFISFRGADVRDGFLSHLFHALRQKQIVTFKGENLDRGEEISPALLRVIEQSYIVLVIFSKSYVNSPWCLDELVKIVNCKKTMGQIVVPIFYHVDPTYVQLTGSFGKAFDGKHESWRNALLETTDISGFDSRIVKPESKLIEEVVNLIHERVKHASQWNYDVFISFRGPDVRDGFLSHLFHALCQNQIVTFKDENLDRGKEISSALLRVIEESSVSLVIFSENYANSPWCLDELVKIVDCKRTMGQIVVPIFYHVDPTHVRKLTGSFGEAFQGLTREEFENKAESWSNALRETAVISGFYSRNVKPESKLVEEIVRRLHHLIPSQRSNSNLSPINLSISS